MTDTRDRFAKIVIQYLGVHEDSLKGDADMMVDLGADSLDLVQIEVAAEEEFEFRAEEGAFDKIHTFGEWIEELDKCRGTEG